MFASVLPVVPAGDGYYLDVPSKTKGAPSLRLLQVPAIRNWLPHSHYLAPCFRRTASSTKLSPFPRAKSDYTQIPQRFAEGWDAGREREAEGFEGSKENIESRVPICREQVRLYFSLTGP